MSICSTRMFVNMVIRLANAPRVASSCFWRLAPSALPFALRSLPFALCSLLFVLAPSALGSDVGDFLGRRVTRVDVVIEGAPNANVTEMRSLVDVAAGQDYSPVR